MGQVCYLPCKFLNHILQNSASGYFSQAAVSSVSSRGLDFRIYFTPGKSANHGGNGSVMVCHHGAGASGTFGISESAKRFVIMVICTCPLTAIQAFSLTNFRGSPDAMVGFAFF